ncbi:hypothetical protein BC831DRAFT_468798 [Entophlyctis helioformis]|nr:hypothetical protein BC831DRAFT_468798 [Entophlyctis helioformis]
MAIEHDDLTDPEVPMRITILIITGSAVLINLFVMAAILNTPKMLTINEVALNMNLTLADFSLALVGFLFVVSGYGNRAAYLDNFVICQLVGMAHQIIAIVSMLTLLAISVNNFWLIVLERSHLSGFQIRMIILGIWLVTILYTCFPLSVPGGGFVKQPSTFHCAVDAVSTHPAAVTARLLNIIVLSMTPSCIGIIYILIARKLIMSQRQLAVGSAPGSHPTGGKGVSGSDNQSSASASNTNNTASSMIKTGGDDSGSVATTGGASTTGGGKPLSRKQQSKAVALQVAIVTRAVILVCAFVFSWGFYLLVIILQVIQNKKATPLVEAIAFFLCTCNGLLNPVILLTRDKRYKEAAMAFVGIKPRVAVGAAPQGKSKVDL